MDYHSLLQGIVPTQGLNPGLPHFFPGDSEVKASAWHTGDQGSIPGSGRSPGEGNGTPLQYSCLENPMEGGAWQATVHGITKSPTRLSDFTFTFFLTAVRFLTIGATSEAPGPNTLAETH